MISWSEPQLCTLLQKQSSVTHRQDNIALPMPCSKSCLKDRIQHSYTDKRVAPKCCKDFQDDGIAIVVRQLHERAASQE